MKVTSWVIVNLETNQAVAEIFEARLVSLLKPGFKAVPILEWLVSVNGKDKG